jgi:hyperosmotically inducible protein
MKKLLASFIFIICLALSAFTACSSNDTNADNNPNNPKVGTDARSDTAITAELKAKITDDELLDNTDVSVETEKGIVALTGTVHNEAQKQRAEELAKNTTGVVSVNDQLVIEPEGSTSGKLAEESKEIGRDIKDTTNRAAEGTKEAISDARITSETKMKFAADDTVKALNIDVDTHNGVVTLHGTVNSKAELQQAISLAKSIDGVKKVNSELEIVNK